MDFSLKSHDLAIANGDFALCATDKDAITQAIVMRLKTMSGEWFLDTITGIPYFTDIFGHKRNERFIPEPPPDFSHGEVQIGRLLILFEFGGIYLDTDVEVTSNEGFGTVLAPYGFLRISKNNSIMASVQGHKILHGSLKTRGVTGCIGRML